MKGAGHINQFLHQFQLPLREHANDGNPTSIVGNSAIPGNLCDTGIQRESGNLTLLETTTLADNAMPQTTASPGNPSLSGNLCASANASEGDNISGNVLDPALHHLEYSPPPPANPTISIQPCMPESCPGIFGELKRHQIHGDRPLNSFHTALPMPGPSSSPFPHAVDVAIGRHDIAGNHDEQNQPANSLRRSTRSKTNKAAEQQIQRITTRNACNKTKR